MERLLVDADRARLGEVTSFAVGDLYSAYCGSAYRVELAVEELFVNVCRHAYGGGKGPVEITRELAPDGEGGEMLEITVADRGRPFNPFTEAPVPELEGELAGRRVGGLGVHLVKTMTDGFAYSGADGRNETVIRFRLDG
ncbi:MAG: ATP-binding protein [Deltaproteobacteria bacterium]|jgi:anti-sigma regulatory factor (Ser/Thr protein kinase)|nr:ATP-binding protein [Deltaproteobacteria bacterium]